MEQLPRFAYKETAELFLGESSKEEMREVMLWLRDKAIGGPTKYSSLREVLVAKFREEQDRQFDAEAQAAHETEDNPTPLMKAFNANPQYADWAKVEDILKDVDDESWKPTLDWTWPDGIGGPAGYTCLHIAASKKDRDADDFPDRPYNCYRIIFQEAIVRGFDFKRHLRTGLTLLNLAVTYDNLAMLKALQA